LADSSKNFSIRRLPTAATSADGQWGVPVVCPIACSQVVIENGDASNAQYVRSDRVEPDTQKTLPAGLELTLKCHSSGDAIFQPGEIVCYIAPSSGAGPVIVTFLR
jgi:hypothetical protein